MPLSLTSIGVRHAVDIVRCTHLPAERQAVPLPLPGAPEYRCPNPCGGPCQFVGGAMVPPPPLPPELVLDLRLAPTLAALVAAALDVTEPMGTADDARGAAAYGSQRYYRN